MQVRWQVSATCASDKQPRADNEDRADADENPDAEVDARDDNEKTVENIEVTDRNISVQ